MIQGQTVYLHCTKTFPGIHCLQELVCGSYKSKKNPKLITVHLRKEQKIPYSTCCFSEVLKELLVEDEGHPADLLNLRLCCRVPVDEVSSDGDGELAPEFLTPKPWGEAELKVRNQSAQA